MKLLFTLILICCFGITSAQNTVLAKQYFDKGEFEKAKLSYQNLYKQYPGRVDLFMELIKCYQQLEDYLGAETLIREKIAKRDKQYQLYIILGNNYDLLGDQEKATENYEFALSKMEENPNLVYRLGTTFERLSKLRYALRTYQKGLDLNPDLNVHYQIGRLYGELGEVENMYNSFFDMMLTNQNYRPNIERSLSQFVTDDPTNENNILLRKILLKKLQTKPDVLWNDFLSWLFIQQKQYSKAFIQEKAIYQRTEGSLNRLIDLAYLAKDEKEYDSAREILEYVIDRNTNPDVDYNAERTLLQIEAVTLTPKKMTAVEDKFNQLFDTYGRKNTTIGLQLDYARFIAFRKNDPNKAIKDLKNTLKLRINNFQKGEVKIALGDILVFSEQFNQALIYYSQVQKSLKNNVVGQQARFKVAQTSYYKGDFGWAQTQLKVLRSSTTQLIANDAMELSLLISDNSLEDSTQVALKKYAKASLLAFQKKNTEAIDLLNQILTQHKGEAIEDEALLKQASLFEATGQHKKAADNYQLIIDNYSEGILADDAFFGLAELKNEILSEPDKAKELYEKIIFDHQDSIYFVEARKKYRKLRGDAIN